MVNWSEIYDPCGMVSGGVALTPVGIQTPTLLL